MPAYYFDSSALVKCYVDEVGSQWVRGILAPGSGNDVHVLSVAEVEVASAIVRRRKAGELSPPEASAALVQLRQDVAANYIILGVSRNLCQSAVALVETHELRAYDALQLAAAAELEQVRNASGLSSMTIVSSDLGLNAAASARGLGVEDPNTHP